jgi:hypothetical protein
VNWEDGIGDSPADPAELAGGDTIDDADALRAGRTAMALGFAVKAASTLGMFLRGVRWGQRGREVTDGGCRRRRRAVRT